MKRLLVLSALMLSITLAWGQSFSNGGSVDKEYVDKLVKDGMKKVGPQGSFVTASFDSVPLPEVLRVISQQTGDSIVIVDESIKDILVSRNFFNMSLEMVFGELANSYQLQIHTDNIINCYTVKAYKKPLPNVTLPVTYTTVTASKPGTLDNLLTQAQKDTCTYLTVKGRLNSSDIRVLRRMAGYTDDGGSTGRLRHLDISEVTFVTDKTPFMTLDAAQEHLAGTSLPGKIKERWEEIAIPLQNQHERNYKMYENDKYWREAPKKPYYLWDIGRTYIDGKAVSYYLPYYCLGHKGDSAIYKSNEVLLASDLRHGGRGMNLPTIHVQNEGQFMFHNGISAEDWKLMKRRKILKFPGHRITQEGDRYKLQAYAHNGLFLHDTFYGCATLKSIVPPTGMKTDFTVTDESSDIAYISPNYRIKIEYTKEDIEYYGNPPTNFWGINTKTKTIDGSDVVGRIVNLLDDLYMPSHGKSFVWIAKMTIHRADLNRDDTYYFSHGSIFNVRDNKVYILSHELTDEFKRMNIL